MSKDSDFIKSPVSKHIKKVMIEISHLDAGFTTHRVLQYIFDSLLLQLTGALEKKIQCIYWEIGSHDHEKRFDVMKDYNNCSKYEDKQTCFKKLCKSFDTKNEKILLSKYKKEIQHSDFFNNHIIKTYYKKEYNSFINIWENLQITDIQNLKNDGNIVDMFNISRGKNAWKNIYNSTYNYRNSIAHNTKCVINNLPDFSFLKKNDYKYENSFLRLAIICFMDLIFIDAFKKYENFLNYQK